MCFFFSSRRRHTSSLRDWSSDVCSSDLVLVMGHLPGCRRGRPTSRRGGGRPGRGPRAPTARPPARGRRRRSEEHTSELQSRRDLVCRLLLEKKKKIKYTIK